eukprot:9161937-Pyramimonas_sp.AAC.1
MTVPKHVDQKEGLLRREASILMSFLCQAIWTGQKLKRAGYQTDSRCGCGHGPDSLSHRIHHCSLTEPLRKTWLKLGDVAILGDNHRNCPLVCGFQEDSGHSVGAPPGSGTRPYQF